MLEFIRRNRLFLTSGCLLLVSLLMFSASQTTRPYRDPVAGVMLDAFAPFQHGFTWVRSGFGRLWQGYFNLVEIGRENQRLRDSLAAAQREMVRLAELEQANRRLTELLQFRARIEGPAFGARIIGRDPLPWFRTLTVDRGERDGVRKGMAVLSPQGVVGQIAEVSRTASRVMLLTDHNSGIDALVQRTRARGIVQGAREDGCHMNYLRRSEDVAVGDRVITSGLDGIFPKGQVIGDVVKVKTGHRGLLKTAIVHPSAPLDRIEEVLIVEPTVRMEEPTPP